MEYKLWILKGLTTAIMMMSLVNGCSQGSTDGGANDSSDFRANTPSLVVTGRNDCSRVSSNDGGDSSNGSFTATSTTDDQDNGKGSITASLVTTTSLITTTSSTLPSVSVPSTIKSVPTTIPTPAPSNVLCPPTLAEVAGYRRWLKFNQKPIQGRTHGLTNIYINQTRTAIAPQGKLVFPYPEGTIIVKEVLAEGVVAMMRKAKGADPAHNNWQWVEYRADGSMIGQDAACWNCHSGVKKNDYVFTALE